MNKIYMSMLTLVLTSCSSFKTQNELADFPKEKACSDKSIMYLNSKNTAVFVSQKTKDNTRKAMIEVSKEIGRCYQDELDRVETDLDINLCLITGYNKDGAQEYFEFSSKETKFSKIFQKCLSDIRKIKILNNNNLSELGIYQPIRLDAHKK